MGLCHYDPASENWDGNTPLCKVFMDVRNCVDVVRYLARTRVQFGEGENGKGGRRGGRGRGILHMDTH